MNTDKTTDRPHKFGARITHINGDSADSAWDFATFEEAKAKVMEWWGNPEYADAWDDPYRREYTATVIEYTTDADGFYGLNSETIKTTEIYTDGTIDN